MKSLFELLTSSLSVTNDPLWNFIIISIIGSISFVVAWNFVGDIGVRGKMGSIIHWTVRLLVMVVLCAISSLIINIIKFFASISIEVYISILIFIVFIIAIIFIFKTTFCNEKEKINKKIMMTKKMYQKLYNYIIDEYYLNSKTTFTEEELFYQINDDNIISNVKQLLEKKKLLQIKKGNLTIDYETIIYIEELNRNILNYKVSVLAFFISFFLFTVDTINKFSGDLAFMVSSIFLITTVILINSMFPKD